MKLQSFQFHPYWRYAFWLILFSAAFMIIATDNSFEKKGPFIDENRASEKESVELDGFLLRKDDNDYSLFFPDGIWEVKQSKGQKSLVFVSVEDHNP